MSFLNKIPRDFLTAETLLRHLPSPQGWRRVISLLPPGLLEQVLAEVLALLGQVDLPPGALAFMEGRILLIDVEDLGLKLRFTGRGGRLRIIAHGRAEASVAAKALDLLLLATQREDADTLFFHRRLRMTGDTALGLQMRNLMDQLPLELLSPRTRLYLDRFTDLASAAQRAHHSVAARRARPASPYQ